MLRPAEEGLIKASALGWDGKPMREVALALVESGWPVFPCGLDKAPIVPGGFKARTKNLQQIEQWWALHPEALPAICPGDNGLAALDVDSREAWQRTEQSGISPDRGLVVESGGTSLPFHVLDGEQTPRHVYIRAEAAPKFQGVIVRYLAGYVIAPGARRGTRVYRATGTETPYVWAGDVEQIKPLPTVDAQVDPTRVERVRQLVAAIPNPLENGREPYIAMAHMIHGAIGEAGRDIFLAWAAKWPGKVNPVEDARVWDTLPPSQLGWEDLWVLAAKHSIDVSAEQRAAAMGDFDILGPTAAPEPEEPKKRPWFTLRQLLSQPELLAVPTPILPYLAWPGRKTLLAGREKGGKSTLAFAAVAHMTRGDDFLGVPTMPQRVLWVTEEALADVARRGSEMEADPDLLTVLPISQEQWSELAQSFREFAPQVVVIDSLAWFAGMSEDSENDAGAWLPVFKKFDKLTRAGVALLLLHHSTKYDEAGGYRGSTAIGANVEAILEMRKPAAGSKRRTFGARSRMGLAQPFDVIATDDVKGYYKLAQGVEEVKEDTLDAELIDYLTRKPGASVNQMMKALHRGKPAINDALERLGKKTTDFETVEGA